MKRLFSLFLIIVLTLSLAPTIHANAAVKLNKAKATLSVGSKLTLKISGTKNKVIWNTNKKSVATVSTKGVVTAKGNGKAKISAKVGKKTFTCYVTVETDYSDWIPYSTGDLETLINEMLNGNVVYIDGKYYCSPEYFEMVSNEVIIYEHDSNPTETKDRSASASVDSTNPVTENINNAKDLDGKENTISGKPAETDNSTEADEIITEEASEWVDEYCLKNKYDLSVNWLGEKIYLMGIKDKYILTGSPKSKFEKNKIYEGEYNGFTIRFQYTSEIVFNQEDLKAAGIIK